MQRLAHNAAVLAGIASRRFAFCGPLFANISLANVCNLSCRFCHYSESRANLTAAGKKSLTKFLDYSAACRLLSDLRDLGTNHAIFLGEGEPLLYPRLFDLIHECRKRSIRSEIFTNGLLLDSALSDELVRSGTDVIKISIMADSAEHYEELRQSGRKDTWERVWKGVNAIVAAKRKARADKPRILLHHMVCGLTRNGLDRMVENSRRAGADSLTFTPLSEQSISIPDLILKDADIPDVCRHLREIDASLKGTMLRTNAEDAAMRLEHGPDVHERMRCWIGWISTRIQTNGDVAFCHVVGTIAGNIRRKSFHEIWQSEEYCRFRRIAGKPGGITSPELHSACNYCCYLPHHNQIRQLESARGILRSVRSALTTEG
jgi:MoaA/NifB/PqqE/SkfB family radical SAM enzyme